MEQLNNETVNLILDNDFAIPFDSEYGIINNVKARIVSGEYNYKKTFSKSFYLSEVMKSLYCLSSLYGEKVFKKALHTLLKIRTNRTDDPNEFYSDIDADGTPLAICVPKKLDITSNIYIGHELVHLLKETDSDEYHYYFVYREVLTILHEFISAINSQNKNISRYVMLDRMNGLKQAFINRERISKPTLLKTTYNKLENLDVEVYALSYYYAILLSQLYIKYPKDVLYSIRQVLLGNLMTKDMLNYYDISRNYDAVTFNKARQNVFEKTL